MKLENRFCDALKVLSAILEQPSADLMHEPQKLDDETYHLSCILKELLKTKQQGCNSNSLFITNSLFRLNSVVVVLQQLPV